MATDDIYEKTVIGIVTTPESESGKEQLSTDIGPLAEYSNYQLLKKVFSFKRSLTLGT